MPVYMNRLDEFPDILRPFIFPISRDIYTVPSHVLFLYYGLLVTNFTDVVR